MATLGGLELLISKELEDENFKLALDEIHNFRLGVIRNLSKADIEQIQYAGFRYKTKTLAGKREEIKQFIIEHPSLMAPDVESLKCRFKIMGKLIKKKKGTPRIEEEEEEDIEEEEPIRKPKKSKNAKNAKALKQSKKLVITSSSEDEDDDDL